jgi:anti-anti-sigma regulatory factor
MSDASLERLNRLLWWALLIAPGCAAFYAIIGIIYVDLATLASTAVILLYTALLLVARIMLARGQVTRATMTVSVGLIVAAIFLTVALPALWINYAVVPMLAATLLLQYAPSLKVYRDLVVCGGATAVIVALGELLPNTTMLPGLFVSILRSTSLIVTITFVLFLLWQFRSRLQEILLGVQAMNAELSVQNSTLAAANEQLQHEMATRQRLVEQITVLETPVTILADAVLYAPILGHVSNDRADQLRTKLLSAVYDLRPQWIIIDIQGVPQIDTHIASALMMMFQAIRLLGCKICVCGVTAQVALVMSHIEVSFGDVLTVRTPQEALAAINLPRSRDLITAR